MSAASELLLLRAALHVGATPAQALQSLPADSAQTLAPAARRLRAGTTLAAIATSQADDDRDGTGQAGPVVRALAVAEMAGAAATPAVDALLDSVAARLRLDGLIAARAAQARLTGRLLTALPICAAVFVSLVDHGARAFISSPPGLALAAVAAGLILLAALWMRRLTAAVPRAAGEHLPMVEALDLLALALAAGTPLAPAVAMVARLGPPPARTSLEGVARALAVGLGVTRAFGTTLAEVAAVVELAQRFGAPAAPSLRLLAADLRTRAQFAAEAAAEQLAVRLVFPTTLLLVPAFGLLVVAPLLASALAGFQLGL